MRGWRAVRFWLWTGRLGARSLSSCRRSCLGAAG
ncbi:hypothetical protein VB1_CDS0037 [Arthrobacter phage Marchesin]|nr:hypothetical protein VB1_CDS0037 [Arthrobacter phage Marchesin]